MSEDLTGRVYGYWTVLEFAGREKGKKMWKCVCKCGTIRNVIEGSLIYNKSKSCGCYQSERSSEQCELPTT